MTKPKNISLTFGPTDLEEVKKVSRQFSNLALTNAYQIHRFVIGKSTITVFSSGKVVIQGSDSEKVKTLFLDLLGLKPKKMLGFDEVGRGEDSGPFVIAGVYGDENRLRELRDSKKTTHINQKAKIVTKESDCQMIVSLSAALVDQLRMEKGLTLNQIEGMIIEQLSDLFEKLKEPSSIIMIDGEKSFDTTNNRLNFEIKADDHYPCVAAASIIAKQYRDSSADKAIRKSWKTKKV